MPKLSEKPYAVVVVTNDADGKLGAACWDHKQVEEHVKGLLDQGISLKKINVWLIGKSVSVQSFIT